MVDIESIRKTLSDMAEKYTDKFDSMRNTNTYETIMKGQQSVDEALRMTTEISIKVDEGKSVLVGTLALVGDEQAYNADALEVNEKGLVSLRTMYNGEKGTLGRLLSRASGAVGIKRNPSLKEALGIIKDVANEIPKYTERLSKDLSNRRNDLTSLRKDLIYGVQDIIEGRTPLKLDINKLEKTLEEITAEYDDLDKQRENAHSNNKVFNPVSIERLGKLDLVMGEIQEQYTELNVKESRADKNIRLINNQIRSIKEALKLLTDSQEVVKSGEDFAKVQVPYVIKVIDTQGSQINALSGIQVSTEFLHDQMILSGAINTKIKMGIEYLGKRVEEVRTIASERDSIYGVLPPSKKIDTNFQIVDTNDQVSPEDSLEEKIGNGEVSVDSSPEDKIE